MQCSSLVVAILAALLVGGQAQRASVTNFAAAFNDAFATADGLAAADDTEAQAGGFTYSETAGDGIGIASVIAVAETEDGEAYADVIGYTDTSGPAYAGTLGGSFANEDLSIAATYTEGASAGDGTTYTDSLAYAEGEEGSVDAYSYLDTAGPAFAAAGNTGYALDDVSYAGAASGGISGEGGYSNTYSGVEVDGDAGDASAETSTFTKGEALAVASAESVASYDDGAYASSGVVAASNDGGFAIGDASASAELADK